MNINTKSCSPNPISYNKIIFLIFLSPPRPPKKIMKIWGKKHPNFVYQIILIVNNRSHAPIPCSLRKVDAIHGKQRVLIFEWSPRLVMENAFFHYTVGENPNLICIDTITVSHILYKSKKSTLDLSNAGLM